MASYVLYVASDKKKPTIYCQGSQMCLQLLDYLPESLVIVKNSDDIRKSDPKAIPFFITGTPTLISIDQNNLFPGREAVEQLQHLAILHASSKRSAPTHNPKSVTIQEQSSQQRVQFNAPPTNQHANEEEAELSGLWTTTDNAEDNTADDSTMDSSRKLTGDDLARALQQRNSTNHPPPQSNGPPPPPPPYEKD